MGAASSKTKEGRKKAVLGQAESSGPQKQQLFTYRSEAEVPGEGGSLELYLVTSGAEVGWTCFMMVWIQFRRIPDVMAERVNSPSFVYKRDKALSVTTVNLSTHLLQGGLWLGGHLRSIMYTLLRINQTRRAKETAKL